VTVSLSVHVTTKDEPEIVSLAGAADAGMLTPLHAPLTEALADARVLVLDLGQVTTSTARRCERCSSVSLDDARRAGRRPPTARSPVPSSHCSRSEAMDITDVEVLHDHFVRLRFAEGVEKSIDLDPYMHGPVFAEIRSDAAVFAAMKVDPDAGTIVWPNGADLAPDVLYEGRCSARIESDARAS
jgi:Protein of unknown function (DUF2442)